MTRLGVLCGYPARYATSIQVRGLAAHLGCRVVERVPPAAASKRLENLGRAWTNLVGPLWPGFACDLYLHGNDGIADVATLRRVRRAPVVVAWYDAYQDFRTDRPPPRRPIDHLRYRNVLAADLVLGVSDVLVEIARDLRGDAASTAYMPTGVDTTRFDPARVDGAAARRRFGLGEQEVVVGYLGRIGLPMGPTFAGQPLLEAARLVEGPVRYLIVAWGERLAEFKAAAARLPGPDRFVFVPFVAHDRVPEVLAACDLFVDTLEDRFLSRARNETKTKEYLAMGRPVVATALGENVKDLEEGRAGLLVDPSPASLAAAIDRLAADPELRRSLGRRGRRRAVGRYDWRVVGAGVRRLLADRGWV